MHGAFQSLKSTLAETPTPDGKSLFVLPPKSLLTPRRMDLAVKWRFFRHLHGGSDPDAVKVYLWHINERIGPRMRAGLATDVYKKDLGDYLTAAQELYESMYEGGFLVSGAIPLDRNRDLLGGAHRLACAIALGINVSVVQHDREVWAPPWNRGWFVEKGLSWKSLQRLDDDWRLMHA